MSKNALRFFTKESLHDATLITFAVSDCIAGYPKDYNSFIKNRLRTSVRIEALSYDQDKIYTLRYTGIRKVVFDFPSSSPLFYGMREVIDDWGYDELTSAGKDADAKEKTPDEKESRPPFLSKHRQHELESPYGDGTDKLNCIEE